jgi:ferredoxin-fold anticodon binding domain-containing protein
VSKFLDLLKESAELLESNGFPEIQKYEDLGRVLTVGENKKLAQAALKAVHSITSGTAMYDEYENTFEDLKKQYSVLRSFSSKDIDDLWEMYLSLEESQEQVENENNVSASISVGDRVTYNDENGSLSVGKVEKVDGEFSVVNSGGRREKVKTSELELLSDEEYADWKKMHWSNQQAASKMESLRTEEIDAEALEGGKQKEIIQVMATAFAVGLAQVENIVGENFENAREAEKFFWSLARMMRTGSASGDLKASLRRFDRIGGEKVLSTFRRDLARV